MEFKKIAVSKLTMNTGQIEGVPANPRQWTQADLDRLAASIEETPELLDARGAIVVPHKGKFVVLGGNMRLTAAKKLGLSEMPCAVLPEDTPAEKMKEIVVKDNGAFGAWDFDALANEWDDLPLTDWGVPAWKTEEDETETGEEETINSIQENEAVEKMLADAMRENVKESLEQVDYMLKRGWLTSFLTKGYAQAKFIQAKFYGKHYPGWLSLYFCPQRWLTPANERSVYDQMKLIAEGVTDAGIAGLRTQGEDNLLNTLKCAFPIAGARTPLDFPVEKAQELYNEFAGQGAAVLDPCHGWGGRLCGALLADVGLYVGIDPSPDAHAGVQREADAFAPYAKETKVELIQAPFEDVDLTGRTFDFALTSPPYFDVEKYNGEEQAHIRYPDFKKWVKGFYEPLIAKVYSVLKPEGVFALQVGSQTYPLLEEARKIARAVGFSIEEVRPMGGGTNSPLNGNTDEDETNEKIIILRKK